MEARDKSEWNEAANFTDRLNDLFMIVHTAAFGMNLKLWYTGLERIRIELNDDMKEKEQKEIKKLSDELRSMVYYDVKNSKQITPTLHAKLTELEEQLREIYKVAGWKTKVMDDPRFSL